MKELLFERALTVKLEITGRNQSVFLNRIAGAGITVLKLNPKEDKTYLSIPRTDCKKFFAICENLCYNIIIDGKNTPKASRHSRITVRHAGYGGYLLPLHFLFGRPGILVGVAMLVLFCVFINGRLIGYSLDGVQADARSAVVRTLKESGATYFAKINGLDVNAIAERIVSENTSVSFASVQRRGSYLVVQTLPASVPNSPLEKEDIKSPCDGVVERIVVLRGTPLVENGAEVKAGDSLVGAYFVVAEQTFPTVPAAEIYLRARQSFVFKTSVCSDDCIGACIAVAKEKCRESNIIEQNFQTKEVDGGYEITVWLTFVFRIGG